MNSLVQIDKPMTQSSHELMACPESYVAVEVEGRASASSLASDRGEDVHAVMARYTSHCAANKVSSDWEEFNKLAAMSGPHAGPMLDRIRDRHHVNWKHVYATEFALALDEDFCPAYKVSHSRYPSEIEQMPGVKYSDKPAAYLGRLDVILLTPDGRRGKIDDYKTGMGVFDADTFQSQLYAFLLMKHLPSIETVLFEQNFTAYVNRFTNVRHNRSDMPEMQAILARANERRKALYANPESAKALPCKVCTFCPKAKDMTCSIAEWNEYTIHTPQTRLMYKVWLGKMAAMNNPILKAHAEVEGPIRYEDGNGRVYEYGEIPVPSTRYPLDATTLHVLNEYSEASGEDWREWGLDISSTKLKARLKAKKRAMLAEAFEESIIETGTKPKWSVRTPEGFETDFNPYAEE